MLDACTIVEDAAGFSDDSFDTTTGLWTRGGGDGSLIYSGKCMIRHESAVPAGFGEQQTIEQQWILRVPLNTAGIVAGQIARIDSSRDPSLPSREWKIDEVLGGTFAVSRRLRVSAIMVRPRAVADA